MVPRIVLAIALVVGCGRLSCAQTEKESAVAAAQVADSDQTSRSSGTAADRSEEGAQTSEAPSLNFDAIQSALERILGTARSQPDRQLDEYCAANALARNGKMDEAYQRMQRLAPVDKPGYPPAHYWIVQQLLESKLRVSAEESQRLIDAHVNHLEKLGIRGREVDYVRAIWLARAGRMDEASDKLTPLVGKLPSVAIMRMEIDLQRQDLDEARRDAKAVRAEMRDRDKPGVELSAYDYRGWAIAEELLGDLDASQKLVRKWLKLQPDNVEARHSLAQMCGRKFQELLATPNPDPQQLADWLIEASELTDDPHTLQRQVAYLYRQRERIPVTKRVIELVGKSPRTHSAMLEAAGTAAAGAGNFAEAKTYLVQAVQKDAKNAIAWNNYAWVLTQGEHPDLELALTAADKAVELLPDDGHFRDTRGQILADLARWQEAIRDLEIAVKQMPKSQSTRDSLAKAYEAVGDAEHARQYREAAR